MSAEASVNNDILALGTTAEECATNFKANLEQLYQLMYLWQGILDWVPVLGLFSFVWDIILESQMKVTYAQLLCYRRKSGDSLEAGES